MRSGAGYAIERESLRAITAWLPADFFTSENRPMLRESDLTVTSRAKVLSREQRAATATLYTGVVSECKIRPLHLTSFTSAECANIFKRWICCRLERKCLGFHLAAFGCQGAQRSH